MFELLAIGFFLGVGLLVFGVIATFLLLALKIALFIILLPFRLLK